MNKYNPNIHHRRSIRLKGYDYSQSGLYFITICVQNRECLFGKIINKEMILNEPGTMVENEWLKLRIRFPNIVLHEYIVMPNHFHAILVGATLVVAHNDVDVQQQKRQPQGIAPTINPKNKTVGDMVGAFQSIVVVEYIRGVKTLGWQPFDGKLWQRNYYEHIIRNEQSYQTIAEYILNNPSKWNDDKFYKI